ncbi:outer membrane beta-barrel protein [Xanthobacter sp. DSM 24535]|uniref:outer membrane protein n=1 Tax=Roseixanthobacter psychrophilus TaxID=3119917 RepID=UPI0037294739
MRPVLICAALMAATPSLAADMEAAKALYSPAPAFSWDRFYIGGNVGGSWASNNTSEIENIAPTTYSHIQDTGRATAGFQAGYNYQVGKLIAGVEADINYGGFKSEAALADTIAYYSASLVTSSEVDWFGTARARIGLAPVDRLMIYATGGLAYGSVKMGYAMGVTNGTTYSASAPSQASMQFGWTAGAGAEYAFLNNISFRIEYLHIDLGTADYSATLYTTIPGIGPYAIRRSATSDTAFDIARAGVNWLF